MTNIKGKVGYIAYKEVEINVSDECAKEVLEKFEHDGYMCDYDFPLELSDALRILTNDADVRYFDAVK